jgi:membrane AbrB-like protein
LSGAIFKGPDVWVALAAAIAGAVLFDFLGLPAPALVGATCLVTLACAVGLKPRVPNGLRDIGFVVIGLTLGTGVTPDFFANLSHYPVSIAALFLAMLSIMFVCGHFLKWYLDLDRETAILSTSPGALSVALALADDGKGDVRNVMVLQSVRLLAITVLLPPLLDVFGTLPDTMAQQSAGTITMLTSVAMLIAGWGGGRVLSALNVPAAYLFAGLLVSGPLHGFDVVQGKPSALLTFCGFTIAGAVIGSRFAGIRLVELKRIGGAALMATTLSLLIASAFAGLTSLFLGMPFGQVLVAFAPGGVEGMSAMALGLGYDPIFVATHHIFRIVSLILLLPLLMK